MNGSLNVTRIVTSLGMIVFLGALIAGATGAFFNDTETSTGNIFRAGALDLKVDSVAHYNGLVCTEVDDDVFVWQADGTTFPTNNDVPADNYPQPGMPCVGTWEETDLGVENRFFSLDDIKPGDIGENTISLHVIDNDAWGCFYVANVADDDNDCTEPETESSDAECSVVDPDTELGANGLGELGSSITFDAWLDHGTIPGFQCNHEGASPAVGPCDEDPQEGDNIYQPSTEGGLFWEDETLDAVAAGPFNQSDVLAAAYSFFGCSVATGNTEYGNCHGLAEDGRLVGSATYYWGLAWDIPTDVGNEVQTDSLTADMIFTATQHRNNGSFQCPVLDTRPVVGPDIVESYGVGFEPLAYVLGDIDAQDGWSKTGGFDSAVVDNPVISDLQSLRISNAVTSGSFGDQTIAPELADSAGETGVASNNYYEAEFEISTTDLAEQPGLALSVSPDDGLGSRMSYLGFADEAGGVRVTFYDVTNPGPLPTVSTFNPTDLGLLDRSTSHTIKFAIEFVDGPTNDIVEIYIDNVLVHTGTTWEDYYRYDAEQTGNGNVLFPVDSLIFPARGAAAPGTSGGGFLFDNVSLSVGTI
ncbi:SipW-dependent-type signal peptide-containing protein [Candidatus Kaiserbacteria bacterium]|nr:SipW-dependent-type signal peptide-containing protein [Candidatus Kaiserbacteria bacterium]MCB9812100.1 hypothetical protein [Candidatus Nomurabacteria bacterium]